MTMAFAVLAGSQLVHAVNQRSNEQSVFARGNGHNKMMYVALGASAAIAALLLFVPPFQRFFSFIFLDWRQYLVCAALFVFPLPAVEGSKLVCRLAKRRGGQGA